MSGFEEQFFNTAFDKVMAEIENKEIPLAIMRNEMFEVFKRADHRQAESIVGRYLQDNAWRWPAYESYLLSVSRRFEWHEMRQMLAQRITMLAYGLKRRASMIENLDFRPYWQFNCLDYPSTPAACRALDGKVFRPDNPIWNQIAPCDFAACGCSIRAFGDFDMKERDLTLEETDLGVLQYNIHLP